MARTIAARITGRGQEGAFDGHGECFIEVGGGKAGFGRGNFYAEPTPQVKWRRPGLLWPWGKLFVEWQWFSRWF